MDVVRLDAETHANILQNLRKFDWSAQRVTAIHFLLAGWEVQSLAAWMGRSPDAIEADWSQFLTHAEPQPHEPCQLDLFPMAGAECAAALYDHY